MEPDASVTEEEPSKLREWMTSTLLIVFTLALGLLCVLVLSCTLTQTRMSSISIDGVNVSVWKLDDIRKQWSDIRKQIRTQSDAFTTAQEEFSQAAKENSEFDLTYRPARTAIDALLGAFISRVREFDEKLVNAMRNEGPVERIVRIEATKDDLLKAHSELQQLVDEILKSGATYKKIDSERIVRRGASETKKARVEELQERLKSLQASLGALFAVQFNNKPIDEPTRARMENALFELYTEKFPGSSINALIVTPRTFSPSFWSLDGGSGQRVANDPCAIQASPNRTCRRLFFATERGRDHRSRHFHRCQGGRSGHRRCLSGRR
jgi:hypothetical protein